jgi:cell wall-associated NlpC family hydrolase
MSADEFDSLHATSQGPRPGLVLVLAIALLVGCASAPPPEPPPLPRPRSDASPSDTRAAIVDTARSMLGTRYRYGGSSPKEGFDCSGLVVYSYRRAGLDGLPRTARDLERRARPVPLDELQPGDLLFFRPTGNKISHVAVYEGNRHFIHAPSNGKGVERVRFDHVYWGPLIKHAGRLLP